MRCSAAFGAVALVFLYVPTLLPENTAYDTRWYHLGLAEHYVAARGIERLPDPSADLRGQLDHHG